MNMVNIGVFLGSAFGIISDEKSFDERVQSGLFSLVYYNKCGHKCKELQNAIGYISQSYYLVDISKDIEAAGKMNSYGIMDAEEYPMIFYNGKFFPDPYESKELDQILLLEPNH
ncbi:hypothetical protein ECANGB1_486 [Enterospora canceri]|uniref:Uncharacterized protein n=1 Tax=Enterospora canceri TaxID=1081671 RepID=A0A1Y1S4E0_9MICR|nr:hypothetical protein ECANGB1_486 [Enterospora canceri]